MSKVYIGDEGTVISVDTNISLVGATVLEIDVIKPDGTEVTWVGAASGTNIQFTTTSASLDMAGTWRLQSHVTSPDGSWSGETAELEVYKHGT
jgi:hypothetical protein